MESALVEANVERVGMLEGCLADLATSAANLSQELAHHYASTLALAEAEAFSEEALPQLLSCLHELQTDNNNSKKELRRHRESAVAELTATINQTEQELEDLRKQISKADNDINIAQIELAAASQRLSGAMIAASRTAEIQTDVNRQDAHALVSDPRLFAALTTLPSPSDVERFLQTMEQQSGPYSTRRALRTLL